MIQRLSFVLFICLWLFSASKAQCDVKPKIMPDDLILCPNTSDTLYVTREYDSYQWFKNGSPIAGATQRYYTVNAYEDGGSLFKVKVTKNGCVDTSKKVLVDGWAFASPIVITNGTSTYFDPNTGTSVFCKGEPVSLTFPEPYTTNIQWYNNGKPIKGATNSTFVVPGTGSYTVTGSPEVCPNFEACQCVPVNIAFDNFTATISRNGDTLVAAKGKLYQWFVNGNLIPGATSYYYLPTAKGLYAVEVTDKFNCSSLSKPVVFIPGKSRIIISPNPALHFITLHHNLQNAAQIIVTDVYGNRRLQAAANGDNQRIQVSSLGKGTYLLRIQDTKGKELAVEKFIKN